MYGWTPDYMLDCLSFLEILMYYENGIKFEETKAVILVGTLGKAMNGGNNEIETPTVPKAGKGKPIYRELPDQTPDRAALYAQFGDKIKRR